MKTFFIPILDIAIKFFWIGFNDIANEGAFVWFDGTKSSYTNWRSGEPNNSQYTSTGEDCTSKIKASGVWNDVPCHWKLNGFACKALCM